MSFVSMGFGALPEALRSDLESCGHAQIGGKRRENQGLVNTRGVFRKKEGKFRTWRTPPSRFSALLLTTLKVEISRGSQPRRNSTKFGRLDLI